MLRPERMSRVSVTGSKGIMDEAIEAMHELRLVHVTDYDGGWEGFDPGNPIEGADRTADQLVTVRSLESILGVEPEDGGHARIVTEEAIESELETVRQEVNELDDRRDDLRTDLRAVEEELDRLGPFVDLGIDLDLLSGYDNLAVLVGVGDAETARQRLAAHDDVTAFEIFVDEDTIAVFATPADAPLEDALVGTGFTAVEVPDVVDAESGATSPEAYRDRLQGRKQQLGSRLGTVESEMEDLRLEVADFLLAAEETLTIDLERREAPLSFATTENAFIAEGWIPTERFVDLAETLTDRVGDRVELEELERRDYDADGHPHDTDQPVPTPGREEAPAADGGAVRTDGGDLPMRAGEPPVVQDNPDPIRPFETLTRVINRPRYSELDPTVVLFLTFPLMFGFMIGDVGYGLLYVGLGYLIYARADSDALASLGGIGMWAGGFTILFGILYGEFFGLHQLGELVWAGDPPLHKGLQPHHADFALLWLVMSLLAGIVHLTIGWVLDFVQTLHHGIREAMHESGSWLLMLFGVWVWIFAGASGNTPPILVGPESVFNGHPIALGFTGFPEPVGLGGLAVFGLGFVLLLSGEPIEGVEFLNVLVNVLSYTRIAAVLLAKAGMAFVVNLLFFGVYVTEDHGEAVWHFGTGHMPHVGETVHGHEVTEIMFGGLIHSGLVGVLAGILILVVGHLLVLALGVTSAGLQGVRLEYVEFFSKFYEGGGKAYDPFGQERRFTTQD